MTRMWPPGGGTRRPLAPQVAMPCEPVDPARIGRREDLADDVRGPAELAEWESIDQLLAGAEPGTVHRPRCVHSSTESNVGDRVQKPGSPGRYRFRPYR